MDILSSPWSPWAIPVPFAQMVCLNPEPLNDISVLERSASGFDYAPDLAWVVDLPGGEAIRFALSLALPGFRPVPLIDGSPGPNFIGAGGELFAETAPQSQEDLSHVLLRWQEAGIQLEAYGMSSGEWPHNLKVDRPSRFRALWQRSLAVLGLRRGAFAGFGDWPHGTGGG